MNFILDINKSIESSLYIISKVKGCDIHKLFKILYFAEQDHLKTFGRPITGDIYIAMQNGPVPGFMYDAVKFVRGDKSYIKIDEDLNNTFEVVERKFIGAKRAANLDYLSSSDIESIDKSICENAHLSFEALTEKSHDDAWHSAADNNDMNIFEIATSAGADTNMLKYIHDNIQNQYTFK